MIPLRVLLAFGLALGPLAGQGLSHDQLADLASVLGNDSDSTVEEKVQAIRDLAAANMVSAYAASILLDRANSMFETNSQVRVEAALAVPGCCEKTNRMSALRLVRYADPTFEPEPKVRCAVLRALAQFECADAASRIMNSMREGNEPDPQVRALATELVAKGLAGRS